MKKLGVGLIGIQPERSWAAVAHIPALRSMPDRFEVVAVSTTKQDSADAAAKACDVPNAFDSAQKLAECDAVDIVAVTVKVPHHRELVETAIRAGKHVYCEWPLGNGLGEAREMARMAKDAGVCAAVGMQARYSPALAHARDLIARGYVGEILSVSVIGSGANWGPMVDQPNAYTYDVRNGATLLSIPVGHTMDGVCQAVGEIAELTAMLANRRTSATLVPDMTPLDFTSPDQVLFQGTLDSGAPVSVHYRGGMPRGTGLLIEINGTEGDLQITGPAGHAQIFDLALAGARGDAQTPSPIAIPDSYSAGVAEGSTAGNVARLYKALADDIADGTHTAPDFDDAVRRHQMLDAIEVSAKSGSAQRPQDC